MVSILKHITTFISSYQVSVCSDWYYHIPLISFIISLFAIMNDSLLVILPYLLFKVVLQTRIMTLQTGRFKLHLRQRFQSPRAGEGWQSYCSNPHWFSQQSGSAEIQIGHKRSQHTWLVLQTQLILYDRNKHHDICLFLSYFYRPCLVHRSIMPHGDVRRSPRIALNLPYPDRPHSSLPYSRNSETSMLSPLTTEIFVKGLDYFGERMDFIFCYLTPSKSISDENSKFFRSRQISNTDAMG